MSTSDALAPATIQQDAFPAQGWGDRGWLVVRMVHPNTTRRSQRQVVALGALTVALALCLTLAACGGSVTSTSGAASMRASGASGASGRTLVVMGASDAYGVGSFDPDRQSWPIQLAADLPQPTHLVNLGIPGATLAQAHEEQLPIAIAQRAQIVVLWLAVNDIIDNVPLATYSAQLRATLATLRAASPQTHVFVGNIPDLTRLPYFAGRDQTTLRAEVNAWNVAISQACAQEGAVLVDLASSWGRFGEHPNYISPDGLHPSTLGAQALAAVFDIVIRQSLRISG